MTAAGQETSLAARLAEAEAELALLKAELDDINMLYQATIEHGEAVEDQLAESNLALQRTQRRLSEELTEAANYIFSILPEPRKTAPRTDWLLVPSTELGGDSFGYHDIDADHIAFYSAATLLREGRPGELYEHAALGERSVGEVRDEGGHHADDGMAAMAVAEADR